MSDYMLGVQQRDRRKRIFVDFDIQVTLLRHLLAGSLRCAPRSLVAGARVEKVRFCDTDFGYDMAKKFNHVVDHLHPFGNRADPNWLPSEAARGVVIPAKVDQESSSLQTENMTC